MALQHCKADKPPVTKPCRECSRLEWELSGLRLRLATLQAEKDELQQRVYGLVADRRYRSA